VQFASVESVQKTGIDLEAVQERPIAAYIDANAEIGYDQTRVARLSSKAAGTVWRVVREVGERVKKGDVLAFIDAAEVGRIKSELLRAFAMVDVKERTLKRIETSAKEGYRTQAELLEAEGALREARIHLFTAQQNLINLGLPVSLDDLSGVSEDKLAEKIRLLGLPNQSVEVLDSNTATANLIALIAPLDGVVVSREVVDGEVIDTSKILFVVADVGRMWVILDIRLEDARSLVMDQEVIFRPDKGGDEIVSGRISWISTDVNEKTRTVTARADIDNPEGNWRAGTFGTARVTIRENPNATAVNNEAIHWEGCCHVVFVRQSDTIFQTRKVKIGAKSGDYTEILIGLLPSEVVATTGSHVLKSEILKSRLGAGCVDD
jgi:cobalt-zinc-cadmium efflux system membrane fusion protein